MKVYLVSGEKSGDQHGSYVVEELLKNNPSCQVRAMAGEACEANGAKLYAHYESFAIMGFWEVLKKVFTLKREIKKLQLDILAFQPDALLLIDSGGLNMRIAAFAKKHGIKVFYYIPPKAWAWNKKRGYKIQKTVDQLFVIFPFEVEFFEQFGIPTIYVGNPTAFALKEGGNLNQKNSHIALLPGSRKQEIASNLPIMNELAQQMPHEQFVVAATSNFELSYYTQLISASNISIQVNKTVEVLKNANCAVVCSGTATLETALLGVPQVVCYKANPLSYFIGKNVVKIKYISLVNILLNRPVVKELMQKDFNPNGVKSEINRLRTKKVETEIRTQYLELSQLLGDQVPHQIIASRLLSDIK